MARTYKRDSRGRFAGGGGSSAASGGGRKRNKARVTTTGTFLTRGKAKIAQRERTKQFSSKATAGRSAREAWKAQAGAARKAGRAAAKPARQPLSMEQRKSKLLQVHGRAMEADLSRRKGFTRYQVRDILDAGSAATVVRNVKKWVGKNRKSMAAAGGSTAKPRSRRSKPPQLRPEYKEVVAANKRRLQVLNSQIRQGGPNASQLRRERTMLRVKISGLESQGRMR